MIHDVLVVGGGPAGVSAALAAARCGAKTVLLERQAKWGRRLLATGNGRANVGHVPVTAADYNAAAASLFAGNPELKSSTELIAWLHTVGVCPFADEAGRLYPRSREAKSVWRAFQDALREARVTVALETTCLGFVRLASGLYRVATPSGRRTARALVLAVGGEAKPSLGGGPHSEALLRDHGYPFVPSRPALAPLTTRQSVARADGARVIARGTLWAAGRPVSTRDGEFLFTTTGLSGIVAMQLERDAVHHKGPMRLVLDLTPTLSDEALIQWFQSWIHDRPTRPITAALASVMPVALAALLTPDGRVCRDLDPHALAARVKGYTLDVDETVSFERAQVAAGGVSLAVIDPQTLQSRRDPGLFLAGEMLDVDGDSGGFNLHFAFLSGKRAGCEAARFARATSDTDITFEHLNGESTL